MVYIEKCITYIYVQGFFLRERNIEGLPGDTSKWIQRGVAVILSK